MIFLWQFITLALLIAVTSGAEYPKPGYPAYPSTYDYVGFFAKLFFNAFIKADDRPL